MFVVARRSRLLVIGVVSVLVLIVGIPCAEAQEVLAEGTAEEPADKPIADIVVAHSFAELPLVVSPGETVLITDASGVRNKFKMQGVSADATTVYLERHGAVLALTEDQVLNVAVRRSDRLWNGALIGGLIGASPLLVTAAVCAAVDGCASEALAASLFTGLIGAGIGVGIDAAFKEEHLVYSAAAPANRAKVVVAPLISGQRKGAVVQIRF